MDNTDFITILAWMKHLKASLVEKMVFAIIYGFSKDRRSDFRGSRQYLADWCECSTKTIDRALASLCDARYIIKREEVVKDVKFCRYTVNFDTLDKMSIPWTKCPEGRAILSKTEDKMSHNNIEDNIDNNIDSSNNAHTRVEAAPLKDQKKNIFEFGAALVAEGVTADHVARLLEIRKKKRLDNTKKAYDQLIESIHTICNMQGVTTDEVVAFMVNPQQNWGAIRPGWAGVERIKPAVKRSMKTMSIADLIDIETSKL